MENEYAYEPVCLIYPGAYVPLFKEEDVQSALKSEHGAGQVLPPVNVTEMATSYYVEVAVPGIKREDFLLQSDSNILSIYVMQKGRHLVEGESYQLHEFNYDCFKRHVILPGNPDFELATAEYKDGMLRLSIPKAGTAFKSKQLIIPVY